MLRRLVALVVVALIAWPAGPASAQAGRDLYIKGLEHLDAKRWTEAIPAFDAALQAVLACPRCGGRLRLLGTIEDSVAIRAILDHLAASAEGVDRAPPPVTLEPATLATPL